MEAVTEEAPIAAWARSVALQPTGSVVLQPTASVALRLRYVAGPQLRRGLALLWQSGQAMSGTAQQDQADRAE